MWGGLVAGVIAAAATNGLEVLTVTKQVEPSTNLFAMIKKEKTGLLTKGLSARVGYNGSQSLMLFLIVESIGKYYNVELTDD